MLAPYFQNLKQAFRVQLTYPVDFMMGILQTLFGFGANVLIWVYVVKIDTSLVSRISYFMFINGLAALTGGTRYKLAWHMAWHIKSGTLTDILVRPVSPLLMMYSREKGQSAADILVGLIFIVIAMFYAQFPSVLQFLYFLASLIPAAIIITSLNFLVGSLSFWTTESGGVRNVFLLIGKLLNGQMIPIETLILLGGGILSSVVRFGPLTGTVYVPTQIFLAESITTIDFKYLYVAIIWAFILPSITYLIWKRGLRKYDGVGI